MCSVLNQTFECFIVLFTTIPITTFHCTNFLRDLKQYDLHTVESEKKILEVAVLNVCIFSIDTSCSLFVN
jgi:hypothetical protein